MDRRFAGGFNDWLMAYALPKLVLAEAAAAREDEEVPLQTVGLGRVAMLMTADAAEILQVASNPAPEEEVRVDRLVQVEMVKIMLQVLHRLGAAQVVVVLEAGVLKA